MGVSPRATSLALLGAALAAPLLAAPVDGRFREANELVRTGDYPKGIALYGDLAAAGQESASLYWNWAQAASARGARGEALWALLRARALDPGDRAVAREVERLRESLNLDPAEIEPEPLAAAGRLAHRFRLDLVALALLGLSLLAHAIARLPAGPAWASSLAWASLGLGLLAVSVSFGGSLARPTGAVVRPGAPHLDAASPSAVATGSLREGEVVPVLEASGDWLRVEDNAGARGWAHAADVRRLDAAPRLLATGD